MKRHILTAAFVLAITAAATPAALAATTEWTGKGQLFDASRRLVSAYDLKVVVQDLDAGRETMTIEASVGGVIVHQDTCTRTTDGDQWRKVCSASEGAGYYFDFGLGQEYSRGADGVDHATQIVIDSETELRFIRTELKDGRAERFFVETLAKSAE